MRHRKDRNALARRALPLALLTTLLLAACGPSPSITVQVGDATVEVVLGGSATTEVALARAGGAAADVTLDAEGAPDWVTVSFAPATLSGDTLTSAMTLATDGDDPEAAATSFTLTVTASGAGLSASDEVTVTVELLAVSGTVSDLLGQAVTGVSVSIDGGTPIAVDAEGGFEGPEVAIPYDLALLDTVNGWAHVYRGLTVSDLRLMSPLGTPANATTVSGDLSAPVGVGQVGIVCLEGVDEVVIGCYTVSAGNTAYSINASWYGSSTAAARVRAWVIDVDGGGATTGFPHVGQTAINVEDGVAALADVTLGTGPATTTVDVTITPPPGVPLTGSALAYRYSDLGSVVFPVGAPSDAYTAVLPDEAGATAVLLGLAAGAENTIYGWEVGEYASGEMDLVMPAAVTLLAPATAAVDVNTSTAFRVSNPSGAPVTFMFSGTPNFLVTTSETETTIPDLAGLGMPLPAATSYTWQALVSPHFATVDDLAREGWISSLVDLQVMLAGGPGPSSAGGIVAGGGRTFTTE